LFGRIKKNSDLPVRLEPNGLNPFFDRL